MLDPVTAQGRRDDEGSYSSGTESGDEELAEMEKLLDRMLVLPFEQQQVVPAHAPRPADVVPEPRRGYFQTFASGFWSAVGYFGLLGPLDDSQDPSYSSSIETQATSRDAEAGLDKVEGQSLLRSSADGLTGPAARVVALFDPAASSDDISVLQSHLNAWFDPPPTVVLVTAATPFTMLADLHVAAVLAHGHGIPEALAAVAAMRPEHLKGLRGLVLAAPELRPEEIAMRVGAALHRGEHQCRAVVLSCSSDAAVGRKSVGRRGLLGRSRAGRHDDQLTEDQTEEATDHQNEHPQQYPQESAKAKGYQQGQSETPPRVSILQAWATRTHPTRTEFGGYLRSEDLRLIAATDPTHRHRYHLGEAAALLLGVLIEENSGRGEAEGAASADPESTFGLLFTNTSSSSSSSSAAAAAAEVSSSVPALLPSSTDPFRSFHSVGDLCLYIEDPTWGEHLDVGAVRVLDALCRCSRKARNRLIAEDDVLFSVKTALEGNPSPEFKQAALAFLGQFPD